jgi:hypothetical protein
MDGRILIAPVYSPKTVRRLALLPALLAFGCSSQPPPRAPATAAPAAAVESDEYTRYELLPPETAQFHILYEVTAIAPGATVFFNPIRRGSAASGERVTDAMTGEDLRFEVVSGDEARRTGLPEAERGGEYIRVHLPRPVPADGGEVRLRIEKTYRDAKSYFSEGGEIVFRRSLGVRRNGVLLPEGYELTACNYPSQVLTVGGRILVSFVNPGPDDVSFTVRARRFPS